MPELKRKRGNVALEIRTFEGKDGDTYIMFKEPNEDKFHVFVEVEAKKAADDCGIDTSEGQTRSLLAKLWNQPK